MTIAAWVLGVLVALLFVAWLGFQVRPAPFPAYAQASREASAKRVPLPAGLPAPVERFYRGVYGDSVPVVGTVVITGRGRIRPAGPLYIPARYRFTHAAGKSYRHYIEATWFGLTILRVNESYLEGKSLMELPWATDSGPKVEQAANIGMWAELSSAAPSVLVTDPRVRWEPRDASSAVLVVPLGDGGATDRFVVSFDPVNGGITKLVAMRYRSSSDAEKIEWTARNEPGATLGSLRLPSVGSAKWGDMDAPWAYFGAEDLRYDVDVSGYIRQRGI